MTLEQAKDAAANDFDQTKINATTEEDIRRHMIEDGENLDAPLGPSRIVLPVAAIRSRVGLSQDKFARALRIPVKTLRNWEQRRTHPDPVVRSFFALVADDPERALKVLAG
jgi:putative transcriptional regulator